MEAQYWEHQLYGAARAAGLYSSWQPATGRLTVCCPACEDARALDLTERLAVCPACGLKEAGEPWEVAAAMAAAKAAAKPEADGAGKALLPLWTLSRILAYKPDPANQIWPGGILTAGDAAALVGAPGVGKSRLALQAAVCTILGRPFLGWETNGRGKKWLFLQTENNGERLQFDLQRMTATLTPPEKELVEGCLHILEIDAMEFGSICMVTGHPDRQRIEDTLEFLKPDIVVIDPLRDAGKGDPNKDEMMTETCQAIAGVVKRGAPKRVPLIIHHGRTGKAEASKVFGDDSSSFARNSKVMYGWLRSQINIAEAGIDHPGVVIVGCGKCSNGRKWEPFAARLSEVTMMYTRLAPEEFNLAEWATEGGAPVGRAGKSKRIVTPEEVAALVEKHGGKVTGGVNAEKGLVQRVKMEFNVGRADAITAVEAALGKTLEYSNEANTKGGPVRVYYLKTSPCQSVPVSAGTDLAH
jgi:hypothetical protein